MASSSSSPSSFKIDTTTTITTTAAAPTDVSSFAVLGLRLGRTFDSDTESCADAGDLSGVTVVVEAPLCAECEVDPAGVASTCVDGQMNGDESE